MDVYFTPLPTVVCGVHVPVSLCLVFSLGMWPRMSSARPPGQTRQLAPTGNIGRGNQASAGERAPGVGGRKSTKGGCRGASSHQRVDKKKEKKTSERARAHLPPSHRAVKSARPWPLPGC